MFIIKIFCYRKVKGYDTKNSYHSRLIKKEIGVVPEKQFPVYWLTPPEFLYFMGRLSKVPSQVVKERIKELMSMFDLEKKSSTICGKLSTYWRKVVVLASALLHNPSILLLDNLFSELSIGTRQQMVEYFHEIKNVSNRTVVFSTHNAADLVTLCDTVVIIHEGVIKAHGTMNEIIEKTGKKTFSQAYNALIS